MWKLQKLYLRKIQIFNEQYQFLNEKYRFLNEEYGSFEKECRFLNEKKNFDEKTSDFFRQPVLRRIDGSHRRGRLPNEDQLMMKREEFDDRFAIKRKTT